MKILITGAAGFIGSHLADSLLDDGFEVVVNARNESDAEDKAYDALVKARDKRKIGPGGGGSIDDVEFEGIEKTNDRLADPSTHRVI